MKEQSIDNSEWQFLVPGVAAGLVETSVTFRTLTEAKKHVRTLIRVMIQRQRISTKTVIFPYFSLGASLMRERATKEDLLIFDRFSGLKNQRWSELLKAGTSTAALNRWLKKTGASKCLKH